MSNIELVEEHKVVTEFKSTPIKMKELHKFKNKLKKQSFIEKHHSKTDGKLEVLSKDLVMFKYKDRVHELPLEYLKFEIIEELVNTKLMFSSETALYVVLPCRSVSNYPYDLANQDFWTTIIYDKEMNENILGLTSVHGISAIEPETITLDKILSLRNQGLMRGFKV